MIAALLLAAGLTAMPQALAGGLSGLWALRLSSGFFVGALIPVANLYIKNEVPEERQGAAFGVASSAVSAGFALGPIGGGLLAAYLGFWAPFFVPGALLVCASVMVSALNGESRGQESVCGQCGSLSWRIFSGAGRSLWPSSTPVPGMRLLSIADSTRWSRLSGCGGVRADELRPSSRPPAPLPRIWPVYLSHQALRGGSCYA